MDPYLIISDIDGTLAIDHQHVTPYTVDVLQQLMGLGHQFYVASGRMYNLAQSIANQVGETAKIIASNGAVYDFHGTRVHHLLGEAALRTTAAVSLANGVTPVYFTDDAVYHLPDPPESIVAGLQIFAPAENNIAVHEVADVDELVSHAGEITNGLALNFTEPEALAKTMMALAASNQLHVSASDPTNIELIPQHVDKAVAIKELQTKTGIPASRTIVFGDGMNDLRMLQSAGVSVAMGNAVDAVKEAARFVTGTNKEDGLAHFLTEFFK